MLQEKASKLIRQRLPIYVVLTICCSAWGEYSTAAHTLANKSQPQVLLTTAHPEVTGDGATTAPEKDASV